MNDTPVNVPNRQDKDFAITAEWANSVRESILRIDKKLKAHLIPSLQANDRPPFFARIYETDPNQFAIECEYGLVLEKKAVGTSGEYVTKWLPSGLLNETTEDGAFEGEPKEYSVSANDYLAVRCEVLPDGSIGSESVSTDELVTFGVFSNIDSTFPDGESPGTIYYPIAKVIEGENGFELEEIYSGNHIEHEWENVVKTEDFSHMWKADLVGQTEDELPLPKFSVKGGIVVIQGTRVEIADVAELIADSTTGFIVLSVYRDSESREYDPEVPPEIEWFEDLPDSDYSVEYTVLAEYYDGITQCRNDEICSQETMIVENGELKLIPFQANSRNTYDLPP